MTSKYLEMMGLKIHDIETKKREEIAKHIKKNGIKTNGKQR